MAELASKSQALITNAAALRDAARLLTSEAHEACALSRELRAERGRHTMARPIRRERRR